MSFSGLSPQLQAQLQPVLTWWKDRNLRERLLVLAGASAAVLVAGDALLTSPAERRVNQARVQTQSLQSQLDAARAAAEAGAAGNGQREQAQRLQLRIQTAQTQITMLRQQAAEAARLPETLRAITATVGSARLLALDLSGDSTSPAGPTPSSAAASSPGGSPNAPSTASSTAVAVAGPSGLTPISVGAGALGTARLYRLPITLKVSGTYEELHLLLTQIERHAEALQWSSLTLDSAEWPAIQLTLKAHVLSPDPRWGAAS